MSTMTIADQITTLLGLPEYQERGLTDAQIAAHLGRPVASIRRTRNILERNGRVMTAPYVDNGPRALRFIAATPAAV